MSTRALSISAGVKDTVTVLQKSGTGAGIVIVKGAVASIRNMSVSFARNRLATSGDGF
jgi:hypothetical protein